MILDGLGRIIEKRRVLSDRPSDLTDTKEKCT